MSKRKVVVNEDKLRLKDEMIIMINQIISDVLFGAIIIRALILIFYFRIFVVDCYGCV